ncbi:1-acylglycerol-3-phosphate O-acyltransferase [Elasticomyces elasticus]|uniref:1-acyl-sn-glycerol-3-phosphate acyltransferase n=1 Tax=Exophiala sideris TaxID=1016849 RepID=A0ABR0JB50_9EURO|nr:1-acylglycerol-3-phosphate O-acyltransferase [Elasticomyces elasticus]KAK5030329.1 1-acylglycerol-3-phosphate O-acyltransferase [Exophiala sideris]KAK5038382.1 1-acylglycerol-3-phosphate O-acyltransferase [Exophiala sideris]KAK5060265.1 1-acylglycerol-3-phosphate O-acyltransferase [Exophiala sideris]KAK5183176.1 1-acylglycerol-3-phosphate O-acyltransferase [Eurotiomycetes sp. CCFEE 6388]
MFFLLRYTVYFLVGYIATAAMFFGLYTYLPNPPRILGFIARTMSAYLSLIVCAAYGTIASAILKPLGLEYAYGQWTTAKAFKYLGMYTMGVKFDILDNGVEILNSNRPAVFIVNHQTELDILLLGWIWPQYCSVTAKKSLRNVPFLGWFMTLSGTVFIDRVDRSQAMKAFKGAATAMKVKRQSVLIFPEGTRSYSAEPMLLPFKKGAFHLAVQAGVPIVPVVAENYSYVLNVKARRFNSGTIRVKVLDPIPTKGLSPADVDNLTRDTREKMLNAITAMAQDKESLSVNSKKDS